MLIAGMSFKGNIDDFRYSFGIYLAADLVKMGYGVFVHDPFMGQNYYNTPHPDLDVEICDNLEGCIPEVDKVIFGTNHRGRFVFELFWTLGKLRKIEAEHNEGDVEEERGACEEDRARGQREEV